MPTLLAHATAGQRPPTSPPVGIEIDGPAGSDRNLLGVALALESILGALPAPAGF